MFKLIGKKDLHLRVNKMLLLFFIVTLTIQSFISTKFSAIIVISMCQLGL